MNYFLPLALFSALFLASCGSYSSSPNQVFYKTVSGDHYQTIRWQKALTSNIEPHLNNTPNMHEWYEIKGRSSRSPKVHREQWSPSQDWHVKDDYTYDRYGLLRKVEREYSTHKGFNSVTGSVMPIVVVSKSKYNSLGTVTSYKEKILSAEERKPVDASFPPAKTKPWLDITKLPKAISMPQKAPKISPSPEPSPERTEILRIPEDEPSEAQKKLWSNAS